MRPTSGRTEKTISHNIMTNNPYQPPQAGDAPATKELAAKYATYDQVPFFRRQWFFWLSWLIFAPVALVILLSGNVYYKKKGVVVPFGMANKVLAALFSLVWIYRVYIAITGSK